MSTDTDRSPDSNDSIWTSFDPMMFTTLEGYWPMVDEIRERCPVLRSDMYGGFAMLTRYDDVVRGANDWRSLSSAQGFGVVPTEGEGARFLPEGADPPYHSQLRSVLNPHFTAEAALTEEDFVRSIAVELLDGFLHRGECEFVSEFSLPLGGRSFFEAVLGGDRDDFRTANEWTVRTLTDPAHAASSYREMTSYVSDLLERCERSDRGGLAKTLLMCQIDGKRLSVEELTSMLVLFVIAGPHTTKLTLANIVRHLAADPALTERLRDDLALIPAAVEEFLRLEPVAPLFGRVATCPIEFDGEVIDEGQRVGLHFGAANRDPRKFEHPDQIDITRAHNTHLAFGSGVHRCIGRHLARLELRVGLEEILRRMPPFSIPAGARVPLENPLNFGPGAVPLVWNPPSN